MKVCIVRNAEIKTNASMLRILDALLSSGRDCILLTRSRFKANKGIKKKEYYHKNKIIDNYEINIKTRSGRGLINIFQLLLYQFTVFKWMIANKNKCEVIHTFDLDSGLPVFIASKIVKKKYIYHVADFYSDSREGIPSILKKVIKKLEYMVINNAIGTIVCTEERKEQIKGSKPRNLTVIHNVPSVNIDTSMMKELNDKLTFSYVGGLYERRFIKVIIDIFKKYKNLRLNLAGMGNVQDYAKSSSYKYDNINYYGMISYQEALKIYSTSDIMFAIYNPDVLNHRYSAPNKVYEAMLLGKPIIVARGTGIDKLVEKEKIGIVIEYSEEGFENALKYIQENPSELIDMGKRAYKISSLYSWDEMKGRLNKLYMKIEKEI